MSISRVLLICGLLCAAPAATAAASTRHADLLIMQAADVRVAAPGQVVDFTSYAVNNGPGGGELNAYVADHKGVRILRQRCQGVSPDTPNCEWGFVPIGKTRRMVLKVRVTGDPGTSALVTVCTDSLGSSVDPDPTNDCAVTAVRISS
jgi:hypothetical protein